MMRFSIVFYALASCEYASAFLHRPLARVPGTPWPLYDMQTLSQQEPLYSDANIHVITAPHDNMLAPYSLRVTKPNLCDSSVKQLSGYFDVGRGKNLFFWFFEARNSPEIAPFILWQNGGPGGSSMMGLLVEQIGPCTVTENGTSVEPNPYSWNEFANILFLDQPSEVGYSYLKAPWTRDNFVTTSQQAGEDVWAFFQLFFDAFPQYSQLPFTAAAESYGGHYAPWVAHAIHKHNKNLEPGQRHINLDSIVLGNAAVDGRHQSKGAVDWFCEGPYASKFGLNATVCEGMRTGLKACKNAFARCEQTRLPVHCFMAMQCPGNALDPLSTRTWNPYNVILPCATAESVTCYKEAVWADKWLDRPSVKRELGVDPNLHYKGINFEVNTAFMLEGDMGASSTIVLPELLNDGIRLLNYAGKADSVCDYVGNFEWQYALEGHPFVDEFRNKKTTAWITKTGERAGDIRSAGNYTYVAIDDSGHMVPMDHGDWAADLIRRWVYHERLDAITEGK